MGSDVPKTGPMGVKPRAVRMGVMMMPGAVVAMMARVPSAVSRKSLNRFIVMLSVSCSVCEDGMGWDGMGRDKVMVIFEDVAGVRDVLLV